MSFAVAIDGPAAAGKGTIGRALAEAFDFAYLDTGLLYRAVGLRHLAGEDPVAAAKALDPTSISPDRLRGPEVAQAASRVAAIPEVRAALVDYQRAFARRIGGAVLDGRDIGTVICPEAEVKIYVTASDEVRAERRHLELIKRGEVTTRDEVMAELRRRDARDAARATAPLKPAGDAILVDTSQLSIDQAVAQVRDLVAKRREAHA